MSSDAAGNYSLVTSYFVQNGDTVLPVQHNPVFEDVAAALTARVMKDGRTVWTGDMKAGGFKVTGLGDGENDQDAVTKAQLDMACPIGKVDDYAGSTAPDGWLLCYGQAVSRATYALLFAVIGTTFGAGDEETTFNVPDVRGRVTAGKDDMGGSSANRLTNQSGGVNGDTLGDTGGAETHELTSGENGPHSHGSGSYAAASHHHTTTISVRAFNTGGSTDPNRLSRGSDSGGASTNDFNSDNSGSLNVSGTSSNAGSGNAHNNVQPTIIFNKIIFAGV